MRPSSKWVELSELSFTFTKKGKVVSNVEAQKLGVGELMARQGVVTNKLADSGLLVVDCLHVSFPLRLQILPTSNKAAMVWLCLMPMSMTELIMKVANYNFDSRTTIMEKGLIKLKML